MIDIGKGSDCFLILDSFALAQIGLMSRDEQNVLVVSYAELKNCLEQSFGEVNMSSLLLLVKILCSVADPNPDPDPHVFGPPGSGSIS